MLIANLTYAQPRYVTPQEGFRELFLPLTRGIPSAPILYEMNLHELEDTFIGLYAINQLMLMGGLP